MKSNLPVIIYTLLATAFIFTGVSCRKNELEPVIYQTRLAFHSSPVSNVNLSMEFNGEMSKDTLFPGTWRYKTLDIAGEEVAKGKTVRFKIYKMGTSQLIVDSTVILKRTTELPFSLIYNQDIGLSGFLGPTGVSQDSIKLRFTYTDGTAGKKFPDLQFDIATYSDYLPTYYDPSEFYITLPMMHDGAGSSPDVLLPYYRKDGVNTSNLFYLRLKDPVTGKYLEWYTDAAVFDPQINILERGTYLFANFRLVDFPDGGPGCYAIEGTILKL